ncbi:MAG: hypothetical protein ACI8PT_001863 [Gammaproteobacteria bacterium]|jgi:hypothetical protein
MGRQIKRPELEAVAPPFFDLNVGHLAKVLVLGQKDPLWVKVIEIEGDKFMGIVASAEAANAPDDVRCRDVIEFERCNIFGLY